MEPEAAEAAEFRKRVAKLRSEARVIKLTRPLVHDHLQLLG